MYSVSIEIYAIYLVEKKFIKFLDINKNFE
jgi:hypothetical protein